MEGITSSQRVSGVLVRVTKLLAINTPRTNGNVNNSCASGEGVASFSSGKSMLLPGYNNLLATNFMVSGFGVISVYMLTIVLPVFNIIVVFKKQMYEIRLCRMQNNCN